MNLACVGLLAMLVNCGEEALPACTRTTPCIILDALEPQEVRETFASALMASVPLSQDWRFAKPASYTQAHVDDDDDEDDEPIFGSSSSSSSSSTDRHGEHTGNSSSQRRAFDEKDYAAASAADGESSDMPSGSGAPASGSGSTDTELYAILNLDKECSTEDVLRSYRSLAVAFQSACPACCARPSCRNGER